MRSRSGFFIFALIMLVLDLYVFQAVKAVSSNATPKARFIIYTIYWTISITAILITALMPYLNYENWPRGLRNYLFAIVIGLFLSKLVAVVFFMIDDLRRMIQWVGSKLFSQNYVTDVAEGEGITRSAFLNWLGLGIGTGLFGTLLYGFTNKYNYQLTHVPLQFDNLPNAFRGLKIIHISDIHAGSFSDQAAVQRGIDKILGVKPDLILFTGDLVNDRATEVAEYRELFSQLKAPLGVYSTLGNHDYGDYVAWESPEAKLANLEALKAIHADMGWRLLMNEHVVLERDGEKLALIGIENWGAKARFTKYGEKAYEGAHDYPFKILMSHDPSHWDAEVRKEYPSVDLTLSGHTHGMQFGVEIPGLKWSPVQWVYKQWAGLYEHDQQKLYVNRGFGFIGYPGRVGILPEITVIELG
jgi:uncharacterized protein